ncbi:MAG TPA: hypothetical protein VMW87_14670 [Spirochaetia bacterium]|nr:hypothetical protein [Spirochaetia bacterium]
MRKGQLLGDRDRVMTGWRILVLLALIAIAPKTDAQDGSQAGSRRPAVLAADLESGDQIIGLLGLPLGELASVQARFVDSNLLAARKTLEIIAVNSQVLQKPIQMEYSVWQWGNLAGAQLQENKLVALRVYETGGMQGIPHQAMVETTFVESVDWRFRTSVVVLYREDESAH